MGVAKFNFQRDPRFWWETKFLYTKDDPDDPTLDEVTIRVQYVRLPLSKTQEILRGAEPEQLDEDLDISEKAVSISQRAVEGTKRLMQKVVVDIKDVDFPEGEAFSDSLERLLDDGVIRDALMSGYLDAVLRGKSANEAAKKSGGDADE